MQKSGFQQGLGGRQGEFGKKVQTCSYKVKKSENLMRNMVTLVNNTVLYSWNFLKGENLNVLTQKANGEEMDVSIN